MPPTPVDAAADVALVPEPADARLAWTRLVSPRLRNASVPVGDWAEGAGVSGVGVGLALGLALGVLLGGRAHGAAGVGQHGGGEPHPGAAPLALPIANGGAGVTGVCADAVPEPSATANRPAHFHADRCMCDSFRVGEYWLGAHGGVANPWRQRPAS